MAKAKAMDRSKYRNPDMPVGYEKSSPELKYKAGIEVNGVFCIWANYIWMTRMYERDDYATLGEFEFSDLEETNIVDETISEHIDESLAISSSNVEKEKAATIKIEPDDNSDKNGSKHRKKDDNGNAENSDSKHGQKGHDSDDSQTDIFTEKQKKKTKEKKVKKERKKDYSSDSSSPSRNYKLKRPIVTYSPPPPPPPLPPPPPPPSERYFDVKIKQEPLDQPQHLFGCYHCEVCNISMNSLLTYETHVNGKRHRKSMKVKNFSEVVALSIPPTVLSEDQTKYPKPRPGVIRKKVQTPAQIQHVVEQTVGTPCPGLNLVIEIQGIEGVQYYCSMCDSVCASNSILPHLRGFKHQLKSVKEFKPGAYDHMNNEPKFKIEKEMKSILHAVQKREGMGRIAVEVEEIASNSKDMPFSRNQASTSRDHRSKASTSRDHRSQPSTSRGTSLGQSGISFNELYDKATIPDQTASDFFCEICQSHMNSLQMWEAHIRGKRHLTNLKKMPGDLPSKTKTIPLLNRRAFLLDRLHNECPDEPIVGLKEIRETQIPETQSYSYQCFLCGSCHTSMDIIDHVISLKHRTKYLDHVDFHGREVISGMSDSNAYSLVTEMCAEVESMEGSGKPAVHISKSAVYR